MATVKEKPSLTIVRKLKAAPEEVWRALTQPDALKQWMAPSDTFTIPRAEADVRIGGRYRVVMKSPDGEEYDVSGVYREIVPNRKLVYTWAWKSTPERESLVTVELRAAGGGTELALKHEQFADDEARDKHQQGWTGSLARLEKLVGSPAANPAEGEFVITRVFGAPRERVWKAWTEAERLQRWWGPKDFTVHTCKVDLRPGGVFLYGMRSPDGKDVWGRFIYREIVAPERLVFIVSFSDANGGVTRHPWVPNWPLETLSTVTFAGHNGKTRLTVRWIPHSATEVERKTFEDGRESMRQGWTGSFDQFDAYLAKA